MIGAGAWSTELAGTRALVRLALRRDRLLMPAWTLVFALTAAVSASATVGLYGTEAERVQAAGGVNGSPAVVALYGPIYDPTSLGALALFKLGAFGAALLAVLSVILVVRHTRAEEEAGRLELLGATEIGRHAPLAAALLVTGGAMVAVGLLTTIGLITQGLPAPGALAFGLAWAATGLCFAGVAAVAAQVASVARAATGGSLAVLGIAYLLRAIGDSSAGGGAGWLRWLSPVGWGQQVRPFQGDRWWVVLLPLGLTVVLMVAAHALLARRDQGAGLLPDRAGPAAAGRGLNGAFGLAWRLHRGTLVAWAAGFAVLGVVFGSIATNLGSFLNSSGARELIQRLGGTTGLTDAFLSAEFGIVGVVASGYAIQVALRLRSEETGQRAEAVLATGVGRLRWVASHVTVSLLGTAFLLAVAGLAAGAALAVQTGDGGDVGRVLLAALVRIPAAWVLTGLVVAAFGFVPRAAAVGWVALVVFLLIGELGPLLGLDPWVMDISPYAHVPRLPGSELTAAPLVWLALVAAVLTAAGLAGFRRRDVPVA